MVSWWVGVIGGCVRSGEREEVGRECEEAKLTMSSGSWGKRVAVPVPSFSLMSLRTSLILAV